MTIDELAKRMDERFEQFDRRMNARFDAVDARFDAVDARFDAVDARFVDILDVLQAHGRALESLGAKPAPGPQHVDTHAGGPPRF